MFYLYPGVRNFNPFLSRASRFYFYATDDIKMTLNSKTWQGMFPNITPETQS